MSLSVSSQLAGKFRALKPRPKWARAIAAASDLRLPVCPARKTPWSIGAASPKGARYTLASNTTPNAALLAEMSSNRRLDRMSAHRSPPPSASN